MTTLAAKIQQPYKQRSQCYKDDYKCDADNSVSDDTSCHHELVELKPPAQTPSLWCFVNCCMKDDAFEDDS